MNKIAKWGAVALLVWWVVHDPAGAGLAVHHIGSLATQIAGGLTRFASSI